MQHGDLISTYYCESIGGRAEVYRIKGKPFENTYSISYFNSMDARLRTKHFSNVNLEYVEGIAENWALGV
jgi:hypothetical protein